MEVFVLLAVILGAWWMVVRHRARRDRTVAREERLIEALEQLKGRRDLRI